MALINVGDLFMDTVYADIIFTVENIEIPGHRFVLSKTSDYFSDLLQSKTKKVEITGISAKVFQEVMRFIYKRRLEVDEWTIEDLMSLLVVAQECKLQSLFSAVIEAVEEKTLDFNAWPLVNSAASVYDSEQLRSKCASFADEKIAEFMRETDLEKFSADLICGMFDRPKMSSFNQDHVLKAICNWKTGRGSSEIMAVMRKICWNKVSPDLSAVILEEFFSTVKNVVEYKFWTKLSTDIKKPSESHLLNNCTSRVDSVLLTKDVETKFPLPANTGNFFCGLYSDYLAFWFDKDDTLFDVPVKRIWFESSTEFNIERIIGVNLQGETPYMNVSAVSASNCWFKYSAAFSKTVPVYGILIHSQHFTKTPDISLRNIVIY